MRLIDEFDLIIKVDVASNKFTTRRLSVMITQSVVIFVSNTDRLHVTPRIVGCTYSWQGMDDIEDDEPTEPNYFDKYKELKVCLQCTTLSVHL